MTSFDKEISSDVMWIPKFEQQEYIEELLKIDEEEKRAQTDEDQRIQQVYNSVRNELMLIVAWPWGFGGGGTTAVLGVITAITLQTLSIDPFNVTIGTGVAIPVVGITTAAIAAFIRSKNDVLIKRYAEKKLCLYRERATRIDTKIQQIQTIKEEQASIFSDEKLHQLDMIKNHFTTILAAYQSSLPPEDDDV